MIPVYHAHDASVSIIGKGEKLRGILHGNNIIKPGFPQILQAEYGYLLFLYKDTPKFTDVVVFIFLCIAQ